MEPEPAGCAAGPGQEDPGPASSKRSKLTWPEPPPDIDKERWDRVASTYKKIIKSGARMGRRRAAADADSHLALLAPNVMKPGLKVSNKLCGMANEQ